MMFNSLEPVMKQLTIIDTIVRLEDNELHEFITEAGVLPYYALSWVITWCSHDLDDLEQITRLFDLFLTCNPFTVIYFAAAVVLSRRQGILALDCDTSTVHSFLTKLPRDLDVDKMCEKTRELSSKYGVYDIQCKSTIALDQFSAVNRFEQDWQSMSDLNEEVERVIRILREERYDKPIEFSLAKEQHEHSLLNQLLGRKEIYTIFTLGANKMDTTSQRGSGDF
ncbi:hypothetical protein G6F55_004378 [Rhizopus delemar]|uniref:Rab-GAP TBC domain-containing protein n=1 Tax=Rhizopus oryzae TaxID=64495 RepID=A0A9P6XZL3_RHIOR|nr:hypothetical protein G6F55_004378 [Rhizopus delemar]KAG1490119.1 hypothetical protein G6F54_010955 [Rhizopus delemar]KAG1535963.1 hypothetical protein G6F51_011232 [Rhizopus arrhizus]